MSKKKKDKVVITPVGYSAQSVTGSCNIIEFGNTTIAVEIGGVQEGHTVLENYNLNKEMLSKIKPQKLDYIFVLHCHFDHIGNICSIYATGKCDAKLIVPQGSSGCLEKMWRDSAKINLKDCTALHKKTGKVYDPFYQDEDVDYTLSHIEEYCSNEVHELTDELSFRYIPAGHIRYSQQLELFIKVNGHIHKILVTSDLGNVLLENEKIFVEKFQPVTKSSVVLAESTYGLRDREPTKSDLKKDNEKIKSAVNQFCVEGNGRLFIPVFSLDKSLYFIHKLYKMFGDDPSFDTPVLLTSPLAVSLAREYYSNMEDGSYEKEECKKLFAWKNLQLLTNPEEIMLAIKDTKPKVVLASSGMLTAGWSIAWVQSILPRSNDCILFCGYCGEGTLGAKIKHGDQQKTITIGGKPVKNRCQIIELKSFSSHMQRKQMINYYKNIQADKIYLLHGDEKARIHLKEDLQEELSKMCKTTKVSVVNKSTVITL